LLLDHGSELTAGGVACCCSKDTSTTDDVDVSLQQKFTVKPSNNELLAKPSLTLLLQDLDCITTSITCSTQQPANLPQTIQPKDLKIVTTMHITFTDMPCIVSSIHTGLGNLTLTPNLQQLSTAQLWLMILMTTPIACIVKPCSSSLFHTKFDDKNDHIPPYVQFVGKL
jgi:hypothetical protein